MEAAKHTHGPFLFCLRRANGRGTLVFGRYGSAQLALNDRDVTYRADHSITMAWVLDPAGQLVGEPLTRDPPGLNAERSAATDPRWGQASVCLHQAGYHDLGEFIDAQCETSAEMLEALKEALAFIDRIEGHGYGGESEYMCAQMSARVAIAKASPSSPMNEGGE
jgi:hypothetical protein